MLAGVAGVTHVSRIGNGTVETYALEQREGQDVREAVAAAVLRQGWALREIRTEAVSLEEFFVNVTAAQAQGSSQASAVAGGVQ